MSDEAEVEGANNNTDAADTTEQNAQETPEGTTGAATEQDGAQKVEATPDDYQFDLPEGHTAPDEVMAGFKAKAKALGLSQADAKELFGIGQKAVDHAQQQQVEAWNKTREGWLADLKADKDFGGAKFGETTERANRALRKFGDDKFIKELRDSGMGDNAGLVRLLARVDRVAGDDTAPKGGKAGKDREIGDSWYDEE